MRNVQEPDSLAITVLNKDGEAVTFQPDAQGSARVGVRSESRAPIEGFALSESIFGEVENLPEPEEGVTLIVSALGLCRVKGRADVVAPDTGPTAIRENGQIKAVRGFVC